jgi:superoxide dismutase, Fe-Mn family
MGRTQRTKTPAQVACQSHVLKMAAMLLRGGQRASVRGALVAAAGAVRGKATLPALPYDFGALEPVVSGQIMELHHGKHHAAYVTNYNVAEEKLHDALAKGDVGAAIALQGALKFNGGGHINHSIFWTNLAPPKLGGGEPPSGACAAAPQREGRGGANADVARRAEGPGALADAIKAQFGSLDGFKAKFNAAAVGVQGSGWGWLVCAAPHRAASRLPHRCSHACVSSGLRQGEQAPGAHDYRQPGPPQCCRCVGGPCESGADGLPDAQTGGAVGQAWCRCSVWMCGSTRTTCSTRTCVPTTSRRFGRSSTGRT